jgi:hypothetical protein
MEGGNNKNRFDHSIDNHQQGNGMNDGFDRNSNSGNFGGRNSNSNSGFDDNNFGGFGGFDRRGFALPSFLNDMGQNNFGNNDRQQNNGMGNRHNGKNCTLVVF